MSIKTELEKLTTELGGIVQENNRIRSAIGAAHAAKAAAAASRDKALSDADMNAADKRIVAANQSLAKLEPELVAGEMREAELRPKLQFLSGEFEHERLADLATEYQAALADGVGKMNAAVDAAQKWMAIRERARATFPNDVSPNGKRIPPGSGLPYFDASMIGRLWYEQKLEIARHYPAAVPEGDAASVQAARIKAAIADAERMGDVEQARQRDANKAAGHTSGAQRRVQAVEAYNDAHAHVAKPN